MFESAEIGHAVSKPDFDKEAPALRQALLDVQYELLKKKAFPVVVIVGGVDGAGKGETVNLLNEWMDPRHVRTHAFGPADAHDRAYPRMLRFWEALPPKGHVGILFGSWYTDPILRRVERDSGQARFQRDLADVRDHERMLAAEGAVIVKLWFHLSKKAQKRRLETLAAKKKTAWRVTHEDWQRFERYGDFVSVCETAVRETSIGEAPWHVIEGSDHAYRSLTAGRILLDAIRRRLDESAPTITPSEPSPHNDIDARNILNTADYARSLARDTYEKRLEKRQGELALLSRDKRLRGRSLVLVFEGMDAAGKGSSIRRITAALDARFYRIVPVAAPTDEERAQPYLWRFWRNVPPHGQAVIFDRSWYGRVLVERVENFCAKADWMRAYHEINGFEEQLADAGAIVFKTWLAISPEEQLRRFKEREGTPHKRFKITDEDWRNRKKWPAYERAVADMIDRTSTELAPWHVVASDDKRWARVQVLGELVEAIERAL